MRKKTSETLDFPEKDERAAPCGAAAKFSGANGDRTHDLSRVRIQKHKKPKKGAISSIVGLWFTQGFTHLYFICIYPIFTAPVIILS